MFDKTLINILAIIALLLVVMYSVRTCRQDKKKSDVIKELTSLQYTHVALIKNYRDAHKTIFKKKDE